MKRPAETAGGVAGAIAILASQVFSLTADETAALIIIVAAVPGMVTWTVEMVRGRQAAREVQKP